MTNDDDNLLDRVRRRGNDSTSRRLLEGLLLPFRAAGFLLTRRSLWPFVIGPAIINVLLFVGTTYLLLTNLNTVVDWLWVESIFGGLWPWLRLALQYVMFAVVGLLFFAASYLFTLLVAGIVAQPFNDYLSEKVEHHLIAADELPERDESILWGILRSIGSSLFVLVSYLIVMMPILALNLIAGIGNVAATILGAGVSALFLALEFTAAPVERRGRGLRERFELIESNRDIAIGFGLGTSFLFWLPVFNLLTIPFATVGGTVLGIAMYEWGQADR